MDLNARTDTAVQYSTVEYSTVQYDEVLTWTDVECNIVEAVSVCCAHR